MTFAAQKWAAASDVSYYVFTVNQDLWLERHFDNGHAFGTPTPSLPGLQGRANQRFFLERHECRFSGPNYAVDERSSRCAIALTTTAQTNG